MTQENKKLTEFTTKSDQRLTKEGADNSTICNCYYEMKRKYQYKIDELKITPPRCGHCIDYLCNEVSAGSAVAYNSSLRFFIETIHQQGVCIDDIEYTDVRKHFELRKEEERSKSTIGRDKAAIKGVISRFEAEKKKFPEISWKISENIDIDNYSTDTGYEREPLNEEEIKKLLTVLNDFRNQLMVLTGIETGPRSKATCLIKVSDVDIKQKKIELRNTKTGGTYTMPLTDDLAALLEHWLKNIRSSYIQNEDNPYLFPSRRGGRISVDSYRDIVHSAAEEAGIQEMISKIPISGRQKKSMSFDKDYRIKWRVDVHTLRHTCKRLLRDNNVSKEACIYALDHSGDVTDNYGINEEACREEIRDKFDGVDTSIL